MARLKRQISDKTSNQNGSQKRLLWTTAFKGSYLEKTSPLKPNAKAPKKTNLASKRKTAASKTKGNAQALRYFKKQTHYLFAFRDQFDDARARRDEKEAREALKNALEKLETRDCKVERNTGLESTSDGPSEVVSVVDDSIVIDLLDLYRSEEERERIGHRSIDRPKEAYAAQGKFASESFEATAHWQERRRYTAIKDGRQYKWIRKPMMQLNRS
jgi:hypothetical protein